MARWFGYGAAGLLVGITLLAGTTTTLAKSSASDPPLVVGVDNGSPTFSDNFNPFAYQRIGRLLIYEPLAMVNPYSGHATPWLATHWQYPHPKTLIIAVRNGVKWNDGVPFTAADVAFTFNLLKKFPALDSSGLWSVLKSVTASGDTVTFRYSQAAVPTLEQILQVPIVPEHIWSKIANPVTYTDTRPVGTGPYVLKQFTPYQYILAKNPGYWQADKVAVPELVFPTLGTNQIAQLRLVSGQWQWASLFIPDIKAIYASKSPYHQYWFPGGAPVSLILNLKKAPFSDPRFREAVAYAINRQAIVDKAEFGYVPPASQSLLTLPAQASWLDPSIPHRGYIPFDPARARAILKAAGYRWNAQGQLLGRGGKVVSFSIEIPSGWTDWIQTSQMIADDLGKLGMQVQVKTPKYGTYASDQTSGVFTAVLGGAGGQPNPYWSFYYLLNPQNTFGWKSKYTTDLLAQWDATSSKTAQRDLAYRLENVMTHQFPVIPLFYGATWAEFSTKNYVGWPSASDPYTSPAPYLQSVLMIVTHLRPRG